MQQGPKLTAAVLNAVTVELEEGAPTACEGTCIIGCRPTTTPRHQSSHIGPGDGDVTREDRVKYGVAIGTVSFLSSRSEGGFEGELFAEESVPLLFLKHLYR